MGSNSYMPIPGEEGAPASSGGVGLTAQLWSGINREECLKNPGYGYGISKRFTDAGVYATTAAQDGVYPFLDSSDTVRGLKVLGGGLEMATAATDNNSPTIQWGGTTGAMFSISKDTPKDLAMEVIFRLGTIVETGILIGLGEEGMAANNGCLADDTGAIADKDFFGFQAPMHTSTVTVAGVYRKNGQTAVTAKSSAHVPAITTWYSYGLRYRAINKYLEYYVNGTLVKSLNMANTTDVPTATCPFDELLSPVICIKAGEAGAKSLVVRSVDVFQRF